MTDIPPNLTPPSGESPNVEPRNPLDPNCLDQQFLDAVTAATESGEWMLGVWWVERKRGRQPVTKLVVKPEMFPDSQVDAAWSCMIDFARRRSEEETQRRRQFRDSLPELAKPDLKIHRPSWQENGDG